MSNVELLKDWRRARETPEPAERADGATLQTGDGGGNSGGMDQWPQSVDDRLGALNSRIDKHLLWLLAAFAAGFIALGGLIINRTDAIAERLDARTGTLSAQVSTLAADVRVLADREDRRPPAPK